MTRDREGITWLASYPKSGNTWLRLFLDAYHSDAEPDINALFGVMTDQAERWYQACSADPVSGMSDEHLALLRGAAMLNLRNSSTISPTMVKTHNANVTLAGNRLIPPTITNRVVCLIRDPRDVAVSYAKHFGIDIGAAVDRMVDDSVALMDTDDRSAGRVRHYPTSWARNLKSYAEATDLDVTIVKYEELKVQPTRYFSWILEWLELPVDEARVKRAVRNTALAKMRAQEDEKGFKEKTEHQTRFFGQGRSGDWRELMNQDDLIRLETHAGDVMRAFGYELAITDTQRCFLQDKERLQTA